MIRSSRRLTLEPLEDRTLLSTCHVTRLSDSGVGKGFRGDLRYCLSTANASSDDDQIVFSPTAYGTIKLTGALPAIADDLMIDGPGANLVTVRRDTGGKYRIFTIQPNLTVHISGLTITNGLALDGAAPKDSWGGGINNAGVLTLISVAVVGNLTQNSGDPSAHGGGIYNSGVLNIEDSLIANNVADGVGGSVGGGIANDGTLTIENSTISRNRVVGTPSAFGMLNGGGIEGPATLRHVTITHNWIENTPFHFWDSVGGGLAGTYTLEGNNIIAGNRAEYGPDVAGNVVSAGYNLIGKTSGSSGYVASDLLDVDPMLGPLADNGGPTLTHALLPGSPAVDAGDNTDAPEWDQRGPGFPRIVNGTIDIGAFEVQATAIPSVTRPWYDILALVLATADLDAID